MCGIAGAIDASADRAGARISRLNEAQRHRGPDHNVVVRVSGFTLGNTRLAIQDPGPTGNQPFVSADGRYHCVFNGEIYNHKELVKRYGLPVRSSCDGEVIPALWAKLGIASLAELRGMFAIALVDSLAERIYLARDPYGIKPLHWRFVPDGLLFASEIRPLLQVGGAPGSTPRQSHGIFTSVQWPLDRPRSLKSPRCRRTALPSSTAIAAQKYSVSSLMVHSLLHPHQRIWKMR